MILLVLLRWLLLAGERDTGAVASARAAKIYGLNVLAEKIKALAQCEMTLSKLGIVRVSADDTAGAAQKVASRGERDTGAVASARAAKIYELNVLAEKTQELTGPIRQALFSL